MPSSVLNAPPGFHWLTRLLAWRDQDGGLIATAEVRPEGTLEVACDPVSPGIWRIRSVPEGGAFSAALPLVIDSPREPVPLEIRDSGESLSAACPLLGLEITRDPWCLRFIDRNGREICRENPYDVDGLGRLFVRPLGYVRDANGAPTQMTVSFHLRPDEHHFGLGEKFTPLDKTRQRIASWTTDAFGSSSERSHKNIPLLISTRGYGLFFNTGRRITYELGTESCQSFTVIVDGPYLDFYVIYGPTPAEILERYTALTGRAPVPPKWSFGLWLSGSGIYRDEAAIERMVAGLDVHDVPCDVIHVDPWWMRWRKYADFVWDRTAFPEPEAFAARLHEKGLKLSLWQHPYISVESELFDEGSRKAYFARRPSGEAYVIDYGLSLAPRPSDHVPFGPGENTWNAPVAIIDLTNPEAREWYKALMRPVLNGGADVFKTDFGEDIPADAVFGNGMTGAEMHNLYPLLYNQVVFEVTEEAGRAGLVWSRAGYAGSQRYPTCWSGDPAAEWDSLACTIRGGLSLGMSGVPFWSNDIGAYRGQPTEELYIRWAQFGLFCSHSRCHGESPREPWYFGERATAIFRRYAQLRYEIFPYLYSCAHEASRTGLPVVRAMPLAFPGDLNAYDKDFQYMLGPWLLVAPVYDPSGERNIYLPAGPWVDYWTGAIHHGPVNLSVVAPLELLPLYVRGGAILPRIPPANRIPRDAIEHLVVDFYPAGASAYRLMENEGETAFHCEQSDAGITLAWDGGPERAMTARVHAPTPARVQARVGTNGSPLQIRWTADPGAPVQIVLPQARRGWVRLER